MRLKEGFITHESDGEQLMVDAGGRFSGLVRSNRTAAYIVEQLKRETTEEAIVEEMAACFDAPKENIVRDVRRIVEKLRTIGAIDE